MGQILKGVAMEQVEVKKTKLVAVGIATPHFPLLANIGKASSWQTDGRDKANFADLPCQEYLRTKTKARNGCRVQNFDLGNRACEGDEVQ